MRKTLMLLTACLLVVGGNALAGGHKALPVDQEGFGVSVRDLPPPKLGRQASDTVWFGGRDPSTGLARQGHYWDWDTDVAPDPFQGWISIDRTAQTALYFGRVTAEDFIAHGDPCVPMLPPDPPDTENDGQLWIGIHQDEAAERDFVGGMGYADQLCQFALSPEFAIDTESDAIIIDFQYFNDSEPAFDYTYLHILTYDGSGELVEEYLVAQFDDIQGSPDAPANFSEDVVAGTLEPAVTCQIRLQMESDGNTSDEDGLWNSQCGPFGCDNMSLTVGESSASYDWESGDQGWTFDVCPGIGVYMDVADEDTWAEWLEFAGVLCECDLNGNAVEFADQEGSPFWPPGHPIGQLERAISNVIAREGTPYQPPDYNATIARWHQYAYLRTSAGTFYRPGWMIYPFTSEVNPVPHWSPRMGQDRFYSTGDQPACYLTGVSFSDPVDGTPVPAHWDSLRVVHEVICNCENFGIPPSQCTNEGETWGAPVIDNYRIGITGAVNAPALTGDTGYQFQDGFGQYFPFYLEPCDVGNSDVVYDLSRDQPTQNDWLADSSVVIGPSVGSEEERWACALCMHVAQKGPCQDRVPGYAEWKARFQNNVEEDWVCARLDSLENFQGAWPHRYESYFHEDDPGFDPAFGDRTEAQEIAPDGIFTPGTQIQYEFRGWWWNGGAPPEDYYVLGPWEFAILPGMRATGGGPEGYDWEYPSVLYIDGFNRGSEYYINPLLEQLGIEYDKYDALDASSNWDAPIRRSFGGTHFNPGDWGNNGCTDNQLLGYRMILVNTGSFGSGCWEHNGTVPAPNFVLFENWLESSDCGLGDTRRALILNGDGIAVMMAHPELGQHQSFANNTLGFTLDAENYREYNDDWEVCVYLEPTAVAEFEPTFPYISLYGNGCPQVFDYAVLGIQPGVSGVTGNLRYYSYLGSGDLTYIDYAQVLRSYDVTGIGDWRTVVDGFSFHHLAERGFNGEDCSSDSASVVNGAADLMGPMLQWAQEGALPFDPWRYPCTDAGVGDDGESHLSGPVSYLYGSRPNPFNTSASIRFSLAREGQANLAIYDVAGRRVKTVVDEALPAGEHTLVWDGTNDAGHRVGTGIFWMQLVTHDGYISSKKMVVLK